MPFACGSSLIISIISIISIVPLAITGDIHLGVLLPIRTVYWPIGRRIAAAVPLAVHDVNSDASLLPGHNLKYQILDSACHIESGLRGIEASRKADVFVGPGCSTVLQPLALLAKIWSKPIVTYAASSNIFIDKAKYSTLTTVTAYARRNSHYTPRFILEVMSMFNWTICAIVTSNKPEWLDMAGKIRTSLQPRVNVSLFEHFDAASPQYEKILIRGSKVARVFLILCYNQQVKEIMKAAKKLEMLNGNFAFLTLDLSSDVFYTGGQWTGNTEGRTADFSQELNGIIDLSVHRPTVTEEFKRQYKDMESKLPIDVRTLLDAEPHWYATFLYDAIRLYAMALSEVLAMGGSTKETDLIVERMFNRSFGGKSGNFRTENGTRVPEFVIGNVQNGTYKIISNSFAVTYFNNVYKISRQKFQGQILWPGLTTLVPVSRPPCGFTGEDCQHGHSIQGKEDELGVILGVSAACFFFLLFAGVLILYRKRQLMNENLRKTWMIDIKDLLPCDGMHNSRAGVKSTTTTRIEDLDLHSDLFPSYPLNMTTSELLGAYGTTKAIYKGKLVAVKSLHSKNNFNLTSDNTRELLQACEIRHVNLNPYVGMCHEPPSLYIVSEYCSKGNLQDILYNDDVKLDWTFRLSFATDIARGMEELHKGSVGCHGNLKSSNIVVDNYWICKVADYGLHNFRTQTPSEEGSGTQEHDNALLWTAPEHLRDGSKSIAGDIYSYGIIIQEIYLREAPFSTSLLSPKEILYHIKKGTQPHCRPQVPPDGGPREYRDLMMMCWEEMPERRPTFTGVLKVLKKINSGRAPNLVDNMLCMMEKYTNNLESIVSERTKQLEMEKSRADKLLYKMLPRSIADSLKAGIPVKAESFDQVTIFYSDIVDFTLLASNSSPMEIIDLLNDLYSLYDTIINRYDVYKMETVGDTFLVVSGLPKRNANRHAGEIANMALHLLKYMKNFKIRHLPKTNLQFRMGIHTGPCVAGVVGLKQPRYDIFGETVNITKHLEYASLPQKIQVSEECKAVLDELGGYLLEQREPIKLKGLGETKTYFLTGKKDAL